MADGHYYSSGERLQNHLLILLWIFLQS